MLGKSLLALLIALAFFLIAKKSLPIPDRSGKEITKPSTLLASAQEKLLKVATFNIQTGKSADGVRNINNAADLINDQHLVGIQEIYAPGWLNKLGLDMVGFGQSQLVELTKDKGFGYLLASTRRRWFREQRGNAVLSRLPIDQWRILNLPDYTGKSFRNMTIVDLMWQGVPIKFINTHLHTTKGREEQLEIVLAEFAKHPIAILVGDFNSRRDAQLLAKILEDPSVTDAISHANIDTQDPENRIDWILTKGFKVEHGKVVEKGISDHPYLSLIHI